MSIVAVGDTLALIHPSNYADCSRAFLVVYGNTDSTACEVVPAQPVDATPSNQLIWCHFLSRIDLYGSTQSEPKQGFVLFELTPANEISLVDSYTKTLSKCCIDPLRPPVFSETGGLKCRIAGVN